MKIVMAFAALFCLNAAIARQITFSWNHVDDWPIGTTVELESNGVSANGITGNQHTLDVPVNPGEVIKARARAIPPDGYQCGNPPSDCQPSDWTSVERTLPDVPRNVYSLISRVENMAAIVQSATGLAEGATSFTVTFSSAPTSGNKLLFIASVSIYEDDTRTASITGFSQEERFLNDYSSMVILTKTAGGSEGVTYTVNLSGSAEYHSGIMLEISGANNDDFFDAIALTDSLTTLSRTPTVIGVLPIAALASNDANVGLSTPSGWSGLIQVSDIAYHGVALVSKSVGTDTSTSYSAVFNQGGQPISAIILVNPSSSSTNTSSSTIDALVQKTGITATSSLSALLQKSFSGTVSLDSLIAAVKSGNVSIDALLQSTDNSANVSVDGLLQAVKTGAVSIDAAVAIIVAATSGVDALLKISFNVPVVLDAIVSGSSTVTASLDGFIQSGKSTTAFIDALLQAGYLSQTDIDAIIAKSFSSTALIDALLQDVATTPTSLDAIISGGISASVVMDALLQAGAVSTASIDALLQKTGYSTVSLDAFIQGSASAVAALDGLVQGAKTGTLSLDAIIVSAGQALATTSLDGLVMAIKNGTVSLDAMIAVPVAGATAGLDALLSVTGVSTVSIGALLQATKTGIISIDGLIQSAKTAQVSIDGLIQSAKTGTVSLDAVVGIIGSAAISLDGILQKSRASGVFLDAIIGLISSIIMPTGRVISIAPTDRFIVIS